MRWLKKKVEVGGEKRSGIDDDGGGEKQSVGLKLEAGRVQRRASQKEAPIKLI